MSAHPKPSYTSSAQLTVQNTPETLLGSSILCVANFPRKQIGKTMSDCLTTGLQDPDAPTVKDKSEGTVAVVAVGLDGSRKVVEQGSRAHVDGRDEIVQENTRRLTWEDFSKVRILCGTVVQGKDDAGKVAVQVGTDAEQHHLCESAVDFDDRNKGQQVLVVVNLEHGPRILTVGVHAFLAPLKFVKNGYVLA
ncbi:hypothetical protein HKX48_006027 [Thoreauomyces humboldtii]|nr:hypothetical protein HKX48_006027 [Thoreauomyces humboldtii]